MTGFFQTLGLAGAAISAIAYLPQIAHLAREHCSAGISRRAWSLWLLSSVLILSHALDRFDLVFLMLQTINVVAISLILSLTSKYKGMSCLLHRGPGTVSAAAT
jgi:lipid-A-disaccharide synthase-like uncharacterized protein